MTVTPELCLVIPVLNEEGNIAPLVACVDAALTGVAWEIVFVDDDSRDGTRAAALQTRAGAIDAELMAALERWEMLSARG